ncbi:MAG: ABC transporter permease, partial [Clostridia bacterium]|nr:ABC transporter permease [Clostridia bacterium]
ILPTVTQAINLLAGITRTMRSSMLEVTRQDYIRTAYAKGVSRRNVLYNHALRNAIIPAVTVAGLNFGMMVAGTVAIESVFAIPGLGRIMINAIQVRDTPTVLGSMIVLSIAITITNLVVDLVYALIDPRIMAQYKSGGKKA